MVGEVAVTITVAWPVASPDGAGRDGAGQWQWAAAAAGWLWWSPQVVEVATVVAAVPTLLHVTHCQTCSESFPAGRQCGDFHGDPFPIPTKLGVASIAVL